MRTPAEGWAEVDRAEAEARAAIDRLVAMIPSEELLRAGRATTAVLNLGPYIANTALLTLVRSEDSYHRLRLIAVLQDFGLHAADKVTDVLADIAVLDPDLDVRIQAMDVCEEIKRLQRLEEESDCD